MSSHSMALYLAAAVFAVATLLAGLKAARQWREASKILPDPKWPLDSTGTIPFRPVDPIIAQMGDTSALNEAMQNSGTLNASAAHWTKIAVILGFIAAIAGIVAALLG
jgi:hypothetical protein